MGVIVLTDPVAGTMGDATLIANNNAAIKAAINAGIDAANFAAGKILAPNKITQAAATLGQALVWNGTDWAPGAAGAGALVTTLPGSPVDGQQALYTDSTSAPTYVWLLQYVVAASKWVCIGGTPIVGLASATVTLPRAGTYRVVITGAGSASSGTANYSVNASSGSVTGRQTLTLSDTASLGGTFAAQADMGAQFLVTGVSASATLTWSPSPGGVGVISALPVTVT